MDKAIEMMARAVCEARERRKPDDLEPGNSPYPWDEEVIDAERNGEPHFYAWRLYVGEAVAVKKALQEGGFEIVRRAKP